MVEFSLNSKKKTEDGFVIREGLIFEAGDYPDKKFQLSPEELLAAANDFKPVSINLEHIKTPFDGKLGFLQSVRASSDGYSLFGEVKLRECVAEVIGDEPIKVSCEWNRKDKTIEGLALTTKPRVKDAVLMSAYAQIIKEDGIDEQTAISKSLEIFSDDLMGVDTEVSKDRTWAGWEVMQKVHDICANAGAICTESKSADFVSKKEADAVQAMHDATLRVGAKCSFLPVGFNSTTEKEMTLLEKIMAKFAKAVEEVQQDEANTNTAQKSADDLEAELTAKLEVKFNNNIDQLKEALTSATSNLESEITSLKEAIAEKDAVIADKDAKLAGFSAELDEAEKAKLTSAAEAKVEELIANGKVLPAKRDALVSLFSILLQDDLRDDTVKFSVDGKEVNRVEAFSLLFDGVVSLKEEVPASALALNSELNVNDDTKDHIERAKAFAKKIYKNRG